MFDNLSTLDLGDIKILLSLEETYYLYALNKLIKHSKINKSISKKMGLEFKRFCFLKRAMSFLK